MEEGSCGAKTGRKWKRETPAKMDWSRSSRQRNKRLNKSLNVFIFLGMMIF